MLVHLALAIAAALPSSPSCSKATAFTGTICTPGGSGKHPAILLLGGSEGGDQTMSRVAPQFAERGFVAASVAYFGAPGLPQSLEDIPVETVGDALVDISKRADVDPDRIAIMGLSKGGELALLAASTYPQIHAVIADVPSPFAWQGIAQGPGDAASSWSIGGKPLPFVGFGTKMGSLFGAAYETHQPLDLRIGYDAAMKENAAQIAAAMFPLEKIHGPVMFIGADDDRIWDSDAQSQLGLQYLQQHRHPYPDVYLHYNGGHIFLFSSTENPLTQAPMGPFMLLLGGTPKTNVAAAKQAWPRIGQFLSQALQATPKS